MKLLNPYLLQGVIIGRRIRFLALLGPSLYVVLDPKHTNDVFCYYSCTVKVLEAYNAKRNHLLEDKLPTMFLCISYPESQHIFQICSLQTGQPKRDDLYFFFHWPAAPSSLCFLKHILRFFYPFPIFTQTDVYFVVRALFPHLNTTDRRFSPTC